MSGVFVFNPSFTSVLITNFLCRRFCGSPIAFPSFSEQRSKSGKFTFSTFPFVCVKVHNNWCVHCGVGWLVGGCYLGHEPSSLLLPAWVNKGWRCGWCFVRVCVLLLLHCLFSSACLLACLHILRKGWEFRKESEFNFYERKKELERVRESYVNVQRDRAR